MLFALLFANQLLQTIVTGITIRTVIMRGSSSSSFTCTIEFAPKAGFFKILGSGGGDGDESIAVNSAA
jgi:hypothetical protein